MSMTSPGLHEETEDTDDFLRQLRDEFVEVTQARLETLEHELARLDERARDASQEVHDRWLATSAELNKRRRQAWDRLQQLPGQSAKAWHELARGIDDIRQDLSAAIARAKNELELRH